MKVLLAAVLAIMVIPSSSLAQNTGNDLLRWCKEFLKEGARDPLESGRCVGFVEGVAAGWDAAAMTSTPSFAEYQKRKAWCVPEGVTRGQSIRVIVQKMEENPAALHLDASMHVAGALTKAFPCAKPPPSSR